MWGVLLFGNIVDEKQPVLLPNFLRIGKSIGPFHSKGYT